jgi:hypothetical protein
MVVSKLKNKEMTRYNPNTHHRHSIRLKGYDYSQEGLYFVTICVQNHECLFGEIVGAKNFSPEKVPGNFSPEMILNDLGKIAMQCWLEIPQHFPHAVLHEFVIMPIIPKISMGSQQQISALIQESFGFRAEGERLLGEAKEMMEGEIRGRIKTRGGGDYN